MTSSGLSIRQYAASRRERGLSGGTPSAVHKAIAAGRIRRNRHGKIDEAQADRDWGANSAPPRGPAPDGAEHQVAGAPARARPGNGGQADDAEDDGPDYNRERARTERAKANKAELELSLKAGTLIVSDDAMRAYAEQILAAKNILRGRARSLVEEISRVGGVPRAKMNAVAMVIEKSDAAILRELAGATTES